MTTRVTDADKDDFIEWQWVIGLIANEHMTEGVRKRGEEIAASVFKLCKSIDSKKTARQSREPKAEHMSLLSLFIRDKYSLWRGC